MILVLPILVVALIDPLEGGLALLLAAIIYTVAFGIRKEKPIKLLWIPVVIAFGVGIAVVTLAVLSPASSQGAPLHTELVVGVWLYRLAVLVSLVGGILTAISAFSRRPGKL